VRGKAVIMGGRKESVRTVCWIEHWHAPCHARRRLASKWQNAEARHRQEMACVNRLGQVKSSQVKIGERDWSPVLPCWLPEYIR
jgi:hypothetical protein